MSDTKRIKLTKIDEHNQNPKKPIGTSHIGIFLYPPKIGSSFSVYAFQRIGRFRTSLVQEILGPNTFRTQNSTYSWEEID